MSQRFYLADLPNSGVVRLGDQESRHLLVSRHAVDDCVWLFDGQSAEAREARIVSHSKSGVDLEFTGKCDGGRCEPVLAITLATCVPKGDRLDWLVEKAVEVGVSRLQLLRSERSVVEPRVTKLSRLERIIVEASKQCGRNRLMRLAPLADWSDFRAACDSPVRLLADRDGVEPASLPRQRAGDSVTIAVGPEGGFSQSELNDAVGRGWQATSFGRSVMRIETAGIVACARVLACACFRKDC